MDERTYTQAEWDEMGAARYAAGAQAAMEAAGFTPPGGAVDAQVDAFARAVRGRAAEAVMAERSLLAVAKGVPPEKAARYVAMAAALAGEAGDFDAALGEAVREFPPKGAQAAVRAVASTPGITAGKGWKEMSLQERTALYAKDPAQAREMARADGASLGD